MVVNVKPHVYSLLQILNDLEQHNGGYFVLFHHIGRFWANYVTYCSLKSDPHSLQHTILFLAMHDSWQFSHKLLRNSALKRGTPHSKAQISPIL